MTAVDPELEAVRAGLQESVAAGHLEKVGEDDYRLTDAGRRHVENLIGAVRPVVWPMSYGQHDGHVGLLIDAPSRTTLPDTVWISGAVYKPVAEATS